MIGKAISHYKILEKIGEGGMGVVYQAQDSKLDRIVALKFLPQHLASDQIEKERFFHEAKAASALNHSNISVIHEIDEYQGQVFIAMEYVEGKTLRHLVDHEALTIKKVLDIAIQVCDGLAAAREKGVIHRDIKSDNIMLTAKGQVKIMDFGLAKLKGATKLTKAGSTLGTAAYMSPEQASGEEIDHRSDIFSLGVVLYELLAGQLPFKGEHHTAIIYSIMNEEPQPLARFNNKVSSDLERIVSKALAKDREERYQHVEDLQADLRHERKSLDYAKTGTVTQAVEIQRPAKKKALPLLAGVGVIVILILVYIAFFTRSKTTTIAADKPSIAVLYLQNLSENQEDQYFAAGMTEDIITHLSKIAGLRVASRSDVEEFKEKRVNVKEVAEKLKVDYVMEGSIRKYGDKVRITCQLIQAKDGFHAWAEKYDRQLSDIFAVQADVAKKVAKALEVTLAPTEMAQIEKKPTQNIQAYNYYLQGREYYFGGADKKDDLELATKMFEKALQADSNFALAYAGLSDCYSSYIMFNLDLKKSWLEKAESAGQKALKLDPHLAEAHRSLSRLYWVEGKPQEAIRQAEQAVRDNPNYAEAWRLLGDWYMLLGQYPEAERVLNKALELKPTEQGIFQSFISLYARLGDMKKAEEYYQKGLEIQPTNRFIYFFMSQTYIAWGQLEEAKGVIYQAEKVNSEGFPKLVAYIFMISEKIDSASFHMNQAHLTNPESHDFVPLAYLAQRKGDSKQAEIYLDSSIQFNQSLLRESKDSPGEHWARLGLASAYALKGEKKKALEQIERVRKKLGDSLLTHYWSELIQELSFTYAVLDQKAEAVKMLEFLVKNNYLTPAFIKLHPFYKNLAGYPPLEALVNQHT